MRGETYRDVSIPPRRIEPLVASEEQICQPQGIVVSNIFSFIVIARYQRAAWPRIMNDNLMLDWTS